MGCSEGYISVPKTNAPERFSIQTGLICNLFGATHPLCKWIDEILPELPLSDFGKAIANKIRLRIRNKITTKLLKEIGQNYNFLQKLLDKIKETNQLIDDIWNTIQGGEVSTLEFCLAGKPNLPDNINWADVFLAFSRVYPSVLIDKLEQIIAFEKYFEYCECRRVPQFFDIPVAEENQIISLPTPSFHTNTSCGVRMKYLWDTLGELGPTFNRVQSLYTSIEQCRNRIVTKAFNNFIPDGHLISWEPILCDECSATRKLILRDVDLGQQTVFFQPDANGGYGYGCCAVTYQKYLREYEENCIDIKYTYQATSGIEVINLSDLAGVNPCNGYPLLDDLEYWRYPVKIESFCDRFSESYPSNYNFREIKDINPVNPCNSSYREKYKDLCITCPEITETSTIVKIIRDCQEFFEPRSLYLP